MFEPVRVAVCGRKPRPSLGTLEVLGRETCVARISSGHRKTRKEYDYAKPRGCHPPNRISFAISFSTT